MQVREGRLLLAALLVVIGGVYAQAAGAEFFWDDHTLILKNPVVTEFRTGEALFGQLWGGADRPSPYWRPLTLLSFMLDFRLFGDAPAGYHLHSLAWHLAASALVYGLAARRLGLRRGLACGLLFGLHPIQSEAVLWIAARNDLMCAVGVFGCLWALEHRGSRWLVAAAGFGALAALSKELGFLLPAVLVLWRGAFGERPRRLELVVAVASVGVVGLLRQLIPLSSVDAPGALPYGAWPVVWKAMVFSASWLGLPWPLTSTASVYGHPTATQLAGAALSVVAVGVLIRRAPRRSGALLLIAAGLWLPALAAMLHNGLIGERYLYLPIAFVTVAVVATLPATRSSWAALALAGVAGLVTLGVRMSEWDTELTLLRAAAGRTPDGHTYVRYAIQAERRGAPLEAFRAYRLALTADPPALRACGDAVRLLLESAAYEAASELADSLGGLGCAGEARYVQQRGRAEILAGRPEAAAATLGPPGPSVPVDELPLRAALCAGVGDLACEGAIAMDWPAGASALRVYVFDLLHPSRPPGG